MNNIYNAVCDVVNQPDNEQKEHGVTPHPLKNKIICSIAAKTGVDNDNIWQLAEKPTIPFWTQSFNFGRVAVYYRHFSPQSKGEPATIGFFIA